MVSSPLFFPPSLRPSAPSRFENLHPSIQLHHAVLAPRAGAPWTLLSVAVPLPSRFREEPHLRGRPARQGVSGGRGARLELQRVRELQRGLRGGAEAGGGAREAQGVLPAQGNGRAGAESCCQLVAPRCIREPWQRQTHTPIPRWSPGSFKLRLTLSGLEEAKSTTRQGRLKWGAEEEA